MSHLAHVVDFKQVLTGLGITCPFKQAELVTEGYVRALIRKYYKHSLAGGSLGSFADFEENAWKQLDKWNCVSPFNANLVFQTFKQRINILQTALYNEGKLPCTKIFNPVVEIEEVVYTPFDNETFAHLVNFLYRELENGCE